MSLIKYSRVVITGSVYNLLLNLLLIPENEFNKCVFITCDTVPLSVRNNLNRYIYIPDMLTMGKRRRILYFFKYRLLSKFFCPALDNCRIYAQDHLPFSGIFIGLRKYAFTEDGPNIFKVIEKQKYVIDAWNHYEKYKNSCKRKFLLSNPIMGRIYANNDICDEIVISSKTSSYIPEYVKNKKVTVLNMQEAWANATEKKKQNILDVFNITSDDIETLKSRHIVVFTQPFYEDKDVPSLQDHIEVYKKVMANYDLNDVIIKTHPRETTDYQKYFPDVRVFNKPVPFQLLDLLGLKFTEAATVCSTAALSIPYPIKINWVGAKIHPSILAEYGDNIPDELKK